MRSVHWMLQLRVLVFCLQPYCVIALGRTRTAKHQTGPTRGRRPAVATKRSDDGCVPATRGSFAPVADQKELVMWVGAYYRTYTVHPLGGISYPRVGACLLCET